MSSEVGNRDHEGRLIDFGRTAADYERHRPGFPPIFFEDLAVRQWITPGMRALDLGTGTGSVALGLARNGLDVTGVDISDELLVVADRAAASENLDIAFLNARAEDTGLPSAGFDLVTAGQCWWWFDREATVDEVRRVLRPGGRLVIGDFSYLPLPGNVAARTDALILRHNPGWPKAGWHGIHPEQVQALDRGGFRTVESFSRVIDIGFSHEAWRGRIRTCNGVGSALDAEAVEQFDRELADVLAAEFSEDLVVPHRIFVATGTTE